MLAKKYAQTTKIEIIIIYINDLNLYNLYVSRLLR